MKSLIEDLLPHAPQMGLYVAPNIPQKKLRGALKDYATDVQHADVRALYDATLLGSAKDGAVFLDDCFIFENSDLEAVQEVRYADVVRVEAKKKLLGGQKVNVDVNRGRSTFQLSIDFSGQPEAGEHVARFLREAMLRGAGQEMDAARDAETDVAAVRAALDALRAEGTLAEADYDRLIAALEAG